MCVSYTYRVIFLALIVLMPQKAKAVEVTSVVETPICETKLILALTNPVAYNVAFEWSKRANLHHWTFDLTPVNDTAISCASYSYTTRIKIPGTFAQYVGSLFRDIGIKKKVCMVDKEYVEDVHVMDTALVSNLHSVSHSHVVSGKLTSYVKVHYDLPWYALFLETLASKHIMKSFAEKFEILRQVLCDKNVA